MFNNKITLSNIKSHVIFKVIAYSVMFVFLSFLINYILSLTIRSLIPYVIWPDTTRYEVDTVYGFLSPIKLWSNFDANYYLGIILNGYDRGLFINAQGFKNWAFFPLYPLTVKYFTLIFFSTPNATTYFNMGILLSNIFLCISIIFMFLVFRLLNLSFHTWLVTVLVLFAFPTSYFLHIFYTESLFLMLSVLILYFGIKKNYLLAYVICGIATATRFQALTLLLFLSTFYVINNLISDFKFSTLIKFVLYNIIGMSGILLFFNYLYDVTGNFFSAIDIQKYWRGNELSYPFHSLYFFFLNLSKGIEYRYFIYNFLGLALLILVLGLSFWFLRDKKMSKKLKVPTFIYMLSYIGISSVSSYPSSVFRFFSASVGVFILFGSLFNKYPKLSYYFILIFAFLHSLFLLIFTNAYPISYGF